MPSLKTIANLLSPDIILITESWCTEHTSNNLLHLPGYNLYRKDRRISRGGGCLIYVLDIFTTTVIEHPTLELIADSLWVSVTGLISKTLIGCIYHSPNYNASSQYALCDAFNIAADMNFKQRIIAGDFNMPNITWDNLIATKNSAFINTTILNGWKQIITDPTRKAAMLDLVFTLGILNASIKVLAPLDNSDHKMILCTFKIATLNLHQTNMQPKCIINLPTHPLTEFIPPMKYSNRLLSNIDWKLFTTIIKQKMWDEFFLTNDPCLACFLLTTNLTLILGNLAPYTCSPVQRKLTNIRNKYASRIRRIQSTYGKPNDLTASFLLAKTHNKMEQKMKYAQLQEESKALNCVDKISTLTKLFKRRQPAQSQTITQLRNADDTYTDNPVFICAQFNDYFASVFTTENNQLSVESTMQQQHTLSTIEINLIDVKAVIEKINPSQFPGPDGIPAFSVKREVNKYHYYCSISSLYP